MKRLISFQTGLVSLADTVVGGSVGPGLSGGQKRRLCVALQMINLPSVLFLDEPTSGSLICNEIFIFPAKMFKYNVYMYRRF